MRRITDENDPSGGVFIQHHAVVFIDHVFAVSIQQRLAAAVILCADNI